MKSLEETLDDLNYIHNRMEPDLNDSEVKQYCTIVRRLLLEGTLGKAWRSIGHSKEPSLLCNDLDSYIANASNLPEHYIALAGGGRSNLCSKRGHTYQPLIFDLGHSSLYIKSLESSSSDSLSFSNEKTISDFLRGSCIKSRNTYFTRKDLIIYYCYVLAGIHPSNKMKKEGRRIKEKFTQLDAYLKPLSSSITSIAGTPHGVTKPEGMEFISILQSLKFSPDIDTIKQWLNNEGT
ncbi:MAG: hypothetical protein K0U29_05365 [Gammaproteobacteria bacterium]|nr:hypothetical protein [Gammaproteobacteria bacterium]MCH9744346.1 hypothetical protein [Gammaproteobacteria bacterium]